MTGPLPLASPLPGSLRGPGRHAQKSRERLEELVAFARVRSPFYGALYGGLPSCVEDPALLPVTNKRRLMAHFDEWATDPAVTRERAEQFISGPERIGERFLGKYLVATTSGTTGAPGIFVLDDAHSRTAVAATREAFTRWLGPLDFLRILRQGLRLAVVHATGGHYVSVSTITRLRRDSHVARRLVRDLSAQAPLAELVRELNAVRPAVLIGYATVIAMLAREREAGRLRIRPALVVVTAEGLQPEEYRHIGESFGAKVGNVWGATEVAAAAYSCREGWLHVLEESVILEPVDAQHRPALAGVESDTVLVTNLANRVQPILRYDLGDRVLVRPDPCPCGNPRPALRVTGRVGEMLTFRGEAGGHVQIPPLALTTGDVAGVEEFQLVQTGPESLRLRLRTRPGADPDGVWADVEANLASALERRGARYVRIERGDEPPERSPGGKHRTVVPIR